MEEQHILFQHHLCAQSDAVVLSVQPLCGGIFCQRYLCVIFTMACLQWERIEAEQQWIAWDLEDGLAVALTGLMRQRQNLIMCCAHSPKKLAHFA